MLQNPNTEVNQADDRGNTPFAFACSEGHAQVVKRLMNDPRIDVKAARNILVVKDCFNDLGFDIKALLKNPSPSVGPEIASINPRDLSESLVLSSSEGGVDKVREVVKVINKYKTKPQSKARFQRRP